MTETQSKSDSTIYSVSRNQHCNPDSGILLCEMQTQIRVFADDNRNLKITVAGSVDRQNCLEYNLATETAVVKTKNLALQNRGMKCPDCQSTQINKNGRRLGKQRYLCKDCGRQFV